MIRVLLALLTLGLGLGVAQAQTPPTKALTYALSVGGLNSGTFTSMANPYQKVTLAGDDVVVTPTAAKVDNRPIVLTGGSVPNMVIKMTKDKIGQQMTVVITVVPVGAGPGARCKFELDHAHLRAISNAAATFEPSELPKYTCTPKAG